MNKAPVVILQLVCEYLPRVRDCLHFELAVGVLINTKAHYVKRFDQEPISNTFRFFKKGQLRTYRIVSYISDGVTYSNVSVAPICRTFQCKHKQLITPSRANHWVLSCISDGDKNAAASILKHPVGRFIFSI